MAPEAHQQRDVSAKADIWSLGCTLIEMANGYGPVWAQMSRYKMFLFISGIDFDPQIPVALGEDGMDFVTQCLVRKPQHRPDAARLLMGPFIVNRIPEEPPNEGLLISFNSESSLFAGMAMTRHISDESMVEMERAQNLQIRKDRKSEAEDPDEAARPPQGRQSRKSLLNEVYAQSMRLATGNTGDRPDGRRSRSLSRQSSGFSFCSERPVLRSIQDVQEVVRAKVQADRRRHSKWLAKERASAEGVDFGEWLQEEEVQWNRQKPCENETDAPMTGADCSTSEVEGRPSCGI